eukprot:342587-Chlamydomonas_euryale.AAC.2
MMTGRWRGVMLISEGMVAWVPQPAAVPRRRYGRMGATACCGAPQNMHEPSGMMCVHTSSFTHWPHHDGLTHLVHGASD